MACKRCPPGPPGPQGPPGPAGPGGGGPPTGPAGGDLAGTYPNPTVDGLQGIAVDPAAPTNGDGLILVAGVWTSVVDSILPGGFQRLVTDLAADQTTPFGASNVYSAIPGMTQTFTPVVAGVVLVQVAFSFSQDGVAGSMFLRVMVDGVASRGAAEGPMAVGAASGSIQVPVALTAAAHTIHLEWRSAAALETVYCRPATQPDLESLCMTIWG